MKGAVLVCGTHSDAGKSVVAAGICRWLHRQGVRVAPFKAQNMSLNSVVTLDGGEVGRAQAVQAAAAGLEPERAMNPVLIKPSGERHSQVIVMGTPYADADARSYGAMKQTLRPIVAGALRDLRERYDVVVCEGAGSPAEINLREHDLTNTWLAQEASLPTLIVADIDRGGVFASLFGTLALLEPSDQAQVAGVRVRFTRSAADLARADLVVVPGTKATVEDLERLRAAGLDRVLQARAAAGAPILGICGGYQLLGERILRRRRDYSPLLSTDASGYEIRHGRVERTGGEGVLVGDDGEPDGCVAGAVLGTAWHGALEHDDFRRALLTRVAAARGRRFVPGSGAFVAARAARLDALGDLVTTHLDTAALTALIETGTPPDLPTIETELRPCCAW
jgi:cobyric acid synthase